MGAAGVEVPIVWRGRRVRAFVPARLADRDLTLDATTVTQVARAQVMVEQGAESMPTDYAALARLLLRAEGVASSFIEGVTAPVVDIVLAEADGPGPSAAAWVAANLAAVDGALGEARTTPLSIDSLCRWHRTLMTGSPTPEHHVGVVRTDQGWIGGTSPLDAHLVTPPPDALPELLADLVAYANAGHGVDPVAQAAIAHAQFEVIHPFADGNGRVGRILVAWILVRRLALVTAPPISARIAADVGGYTSGLVQFRMGDHDRWVQWFAGAVSGAGRAQQELVAAVRDLRAAWIDRLAAPRPGSGRLRSNAAAWRVLDLLPRHLVLTGPLVARELGIPLKSATAALGDLVEARVLVEHGTRSPAGRGRPGRLYAATELLGLTGSTPLRA